MMISPGKKSPGVCSPRTSVPLRGLFADGIWRCNCRDRPPAAKLQTKNHGLNHGRWFYTCQQPQPKKCNFFLWTSDAEPREKLTVLSNSRSESISGVQTPSKATSQESGLLTPQTTERKMLDIPSLKPTTNTPSSASAKAKMMSEDMEEFEWDEDMDAEVGQIPEHRPSRQPDFGRQETPRKAPRTATLTSPGKRKLSDMESEATLTPQSHYGSSSFSSFSFSSPQATRLPLSLADTANLTPTPSKFTNIFSPGSGTDPAPLSRQVLTLLQSHQVILPKGVQDELTALVDRHDLRTQGIIRGRDISRISLRKKDEQIMRLNERVASLESQREMDRAIIDGLRSQTRR